MVKPSKSKHVSSKHLAYSRDGLSPLQQQQHLAHNNQYHQGTHRSQRSNAAVSQMMLASNPTSVNHPFNGPMPAAYYNSLASSTNHTATTNSCTIDLLTKQSPLVPKTSMNTRPAIITGASILSQDFFLKSNGNVESNHATQKQHQPTTDNDRNLSVTMPQDHHTNGNQVDLIDFNPDNSIGHDVEPFSRASLNNQSSRSDCREVDQQANVSSSSDQRPSSKDDTSKPKKYQPPLKHSSRDSVGNLTTRDLINDLKSLIFDEDGASTSYEAQPSTSNGRNPNNIERLYNDQQPTDTREGDNRQYFQSHHPTTTLHLSSEYFKGPQTAPTTDTTVPVAQKAIENTTSRQDILEAKNSSNDKPISCAQNSIMQQAHDNPMIVIAKRNKTDVEEPVPGPSNPAPIGNPIASTSNNTVGILKQTDHSSGGLSTTSQSQADLIDLIPVASNTNEGSARPANNHDHHRKHNSKSSRRAKRHAAHDKRFLTMSKLPTITCAPEVAKQHLEQYNADLPPHWEARLDSHGRVFYIDHQRRTTTWHRPPSTVNVGSSVMKIKVPQSQITEIEVEGRSLGSSNPPPISVSPDAVTGVSTTANAAALVTDQTDQQRALLDRRYTLRRSISTRRPNVTPNIDLDDSGQQSHIVDPVAIKSSGHHPESNVGEIINQDILDGNCMSASSTSRARSYNLCLEQPIAGPSHQQPSPSTSTAHINGGDAITVQQPINEVQSTPIPNKQVNIQLACPQALKFLSRPDFFNQLHMNDEALRLYNQSTYLKYIINKVRKDKNHYERFQHNKYLVDFLNKFSLVHEKLPPGWAMKQDEQGKRFFIDHIHRVTTYVDPRLPTELPLINPSRQPLLDHRTPANMSAVPGQLGGFGPADSRSDTSLSGQNRLASSDGRRRVAVGRSIVNTNTSSSSDNTTQPLPSTSSGQQTPSSVSYEEKIVAFFKLPNISDIIKDKRTSAALMNSSLKEKINQIRKGGVPVLKKFSHDVNLMMIINIFDSEIDAITTAPTSSSTPSSRAQSSRPSINRIIAPGKRDFEEKLRSFYKKLEQKGFGQGPNKLKLSIRRDHILEDAFTKVMTVNAKKDLQRSRLYVSFVGEEGLDYGGPSREFFFLLSRELFNPYYGLFEYSANDTYTVQISPMSRFVDNYHDWFRFSGRMLGLALIHQYLLDAFFTRPFYKALLGLDCSLSDLEYLDAEFHQSLLWVKDSDISDMDLDLTFSVIEEIAGKVVEKELKANGRNVAVTEKNKREYIERMVKWRLERGVSEQTESLVKGFYEVSGSHTDNPAENSV